MHVPRQPEPSSAAPRRRRRVKKQTDTPVDILEQPVSLTDSVLGIPTSFLNSLPMETSQSPQPNVSVSRSITSFESNEEEFVDLFHIIPDPRLVIKRIRILGSSDGIGGIRVVNVETDEELISETVQNEELSAIDLPDLPENPTDIVVIQANPGGSSMIVSQVEVWTEIIPESAS